MCYLNTSPPDFFKQKNREMKIEQELFDAVFVTHSDYLGGFVMIEVGEDEVRIEQSKSREVALAIHPDLEREKEEFAIKFTEWFTKNTGRFTDDIIALREGNHCERYEKWLFHKAEEFYKTQWTHPEKMDEFYKSRQRFSYNDMIKFASDFASQQKPEIACRFEPMTSISLSDVCKNCGQGKFMHLQNDQQKPVAIHVELLRQLESLADYIPAEVYTKKVIELKTRIQPSDLQKEVERYKNTLEDLKLRFTSFGEPRDIIIQQALDKINEALNK